VKNWGETGIQKPSESIWYYLMKLL
jgi:hypothetical protein